MNVDEAIRRLRVVRQFDGRPLAPQHLAVILKAGRRASSSKNRQRWDFIVVTDRSILIDLAAVGPFAGHVAGAAVAIALVTPDPLGAGDHSSLQWDAGLASQNMILAAWTLGIGSCPATVYEPEVARRLLGYPEDRFCEHLLSFGYPADPADLTRPLRPGGRKPLDALVHENRW